MVSTRPVDVILLHPSDNVCVAARRLDRAASVELLGISLATSEAIPQGHKIALREIAAGEPIVKYGQTIGFASQTIRPGAWVHSHNVEAGKFERDYAPCSAVPAPPAPLEGFSFQGYRRPDGRAGTRNYLAIISNVNCSATVARQVARRFDASVLRQFPNVDGVIAFTHGGGCGIEYGGLQHQILNRVQGGIARHPNIGGYLIIGLGCETSTIGSLLDDQRLVQISGIGKPAVRPPTLSMQDMGGTQKTIDAALRLIGELLPRINDVRRETLPASEIMLGTNCGGSDGNSGITANPALGVASDRLVAAGATSILAETTEIYGAEQLLTRRARTPQVADKLIERIRWWEWYSGVFGCTPDNNPSPGNKEGGLTTIYEKSLGAVAKAGSTAMTAVYEYAEPVTAKGFVVMDTPGFDPVSVTGLIAGGANMVVFTTGRGSCFGCKPTPSIKIATTTSLYERMPDDMDIDAGTILSGEPIEAVGRRIFDEILAVASGKRTKSELQGFGDEEFVPWTIGPIL
jgi:altronate hydrolase